MVKTILNFDHFNHLKLPFYEDLKKPFNVVELFRGAQPDQAIQENADSTVAILCNTPHKITRRMIEALPNLEIISTNSVGFDHIDLDAAQERGIVVSHTPDIVTNDTADIALSLMINVLRRIVEADAYVRVGNWERKGDIGLGHSLTDKKVGIVGLGRIGKAIARRAEAVECKVSYFGRSKKDDVAYEFVPDLLDLAKQSDVLVVVCASTPETKNLINMDVLEALGPNGYLVNVSRGAVVHEEDLLIALANKAIAGAGLDVYQNEPRVPDALKTMDNVVLLPHIGTATKETRTEMAKLAIANIVHWFDKGETLTRVV